MLAFKEMSVNNILLGIAVGLFTSFLVGIFLLWKGEHIAQQLKRLPIKWRTILFTKAYIRALESYPYRFVHLMLLACAESIIIVTLALYGMLTYHVFYYGADGLRELNLISIDDPSAAFILAGITITLGYMAVHFTVKIISVEVLVPFAHRDLTRISECVANCGTKLQYIKYINLENNAKSTGDLIDLVTFAKEIIKPATLNIADEILDSISAHGLQEKTIDDSN